MFFQMKKKAENKQSALGYGSEVTSSLNSAKQQTVTWQVK